MTPSGREVVERFMHAINAGDLDAAEALLHPDYQEDYPQSRERIRGRQRWRAVIEHYPGGLGSPAMDVEEARILGGEERWLMTPNFTTIRVNEAGGDRYTGVIKARYSDGTWWYVIVFAELRDARIWRSRTFFAPVFEPPEWRRAWVEPIPEGE